jgi:CBS domain-containing protein
MDRLKRKKISRLLVLEKGELVGIITKRDLARTLGTSRKHNLPSGRLHVSTAMQGNVVTTTPEEEIPAVARTMLEKEIDGLPVMDGGKLVGIITKTDTLRACTGLTQRVEEVMSNKTITVLPGDSLVHARRIILDNSIRALPVVSEGKVIGILSEGDLAEAFETFRRLVEGRHMPSRVKGMLVDELMTHDAITIGKDEPASKAAEKMLEKRIETLPVVEGGKLIGIVTKTDLTRLLQ